MPEFLAKYFQTPTYWNDISLGIVGSAQGGFNASKLSELIVPVPPIDEQKRIVEILDKAFEDIAKAEDNTQRNLINARKISNSYLNKFFRDKKSNGWTEISLGEIATFRNGLSYTKSSQGDLIKMVGVKDFQDYFWLDESQLATVKIDGTLKETDVLKKGDILTVRSNGNKELIGRCILVNNLSQKTSHSGFTIRIRLFKNDIYPQFLVYLLKSQDIRKKLIESGGGIGINSLNQQSLSSLTINYPSLLEQKLIVNTLETLYLKNQKLETIYQRKLEALAELKQSILQKAFTGQLSH